MKSWFRSALVLSAGLVVAAAAATVGLNSAAATPTGIAGVPGKSPASGHSPAVGRPDVTNSVFVPLTPCRIVDTRSTSAGKIALNGTRSFLAFTNGSLASQGGNARGCGVGFGATAIAANVTVTQASTNGYMSAYPFGTAEPASNFTTYYGDRDVTSNPEIPLASSGSLDDFTVHNHGGATHLIVDVTGYYIPQYEAFVDTAGDLLNGSSRAIVAIPVSTGRYQVGFDGALENCAATATPITPFYYATADTNGSVVNVTTWTLDVNHNPVLTNDSFNLIVSC